MQEPIIFTNWDDFKKAMEVAGVTYIRVYGDMYIDNDAEFAFLVSYKKFDTLFKLKEKVTNE